MQPKTPKRRAAMRRANRPMPRRRIDLAVDAIDYKNPELLKRFEALSPEEQARLLAETGADPIGSQASEQQA